GEVDGDDDDVVLGDAVGGQAGGEVVDAAEDALDGVLPFGGTADAHVLRDADALPRLEAVEEADQLGTKGARRGPENRFAHEVSPCESVFLDMIGGASDGYKRKVPCIAWRRGRTPSRASALSSLSRIVTDGL